MKIVSRKLIIATLTGFLFASFVNMVPADLYAKCGIPDPNEPTICQDEFFGSNDIIFYDPNAEDCETPAASGSSAMIGNDNAEKIFRYLVGKGLNAGQAAGFLGNMQQESGFNPAVRQGGAIAPDDFIPIHEEGFGIVQWTHGATAPGTRQGDLYALAKSTSRNITDLGLQMDYVWIELNGGWKITLDRLQGVTDPVQAAIIVHDHYEISADTPQEVIDIRGGNAKGFYDKYKDLAPSTATTPASPTSSGCQTAAGGGAATEFMSDNFVIYNQCPYPPFGGPWGNLTTPYGKTMCESACGPTSLAMIARNMLGGNVTPLDTINYYTENGHWYPGGGSLISALNASAGNFGLNASTIANKGDVAAYKEVFDKGGLITVSSRGSSPFLPQGHTIVLRGITAEGNFLIADPGYRETNIAPANQISIDKILSDVRADSSSSSSAYYKK